MTCLKCGSKNVEVISEPCVVAVNRFPKVDYYGDGSKYVAIGVHYHETKCFNCGDTDADVCVHD